jgi:hypothetical protein
MKFSGEVLLHRLLGKLIEFHQFFAVFVSRTGKLRMWHMTSMWRFDQRIIVATAFPSNSKPGVEVRLRRDAQLDDETLTLLRCC